MQNGNLLSQLWMRHRSFLPHLRRVALISAIAPVILLDAYTYLTFKSDIYSSILDETSQILAFLPFAFVKDRRVGIATFSTVLLATFSTSGSHVVWAWILVYAMAIDLLADRKSKLALIQLFIFLLAQLISGIPILPAAFWTILWGIFCASVGILIRNTKDRLEEMRQEAERSREIAAELIQQLRRDIADSLKNGRVYEDDPRLARARKGLRQSVAHYAELHRDAAELPQLQRLAANLQSINYQLSHLESGLTEEQSGDLRIAHHDSAKLKDAFKSIRRQLTPEAPTFRHAVRMAVLVLFCGLVVETLQLNFGYWILLTAVFVCQPNHSATQSRLKQRIAGTLAGVLVGSLLPYFTQSLEAKLMVMTAGVALFFLFRANKYSYSTFFITIQALIGFSIAGFDIAQALPMRMADTVVGCLLAWAAVSYIWPDWHYLQLGKTGAAAIAADAGYLRGILDSLKSGGGEDVAYRSARRLSHERAAALSSTLSDMSAEPSKYGSRLSDGFQLLKINYSLIGYISALGAYRSTIRRDDEHQPFLQQYFPAAYHLCDLLEAVPELGKTDFKARLADVQAELEQLHPHDGREQNSLLWQQLSATAALLEPAHSALHGPSAAAAATGNDSGNPSGQALDHSADTEGGRQTAPQETPKAETAETAGAQGVN